MIEVTAAIIQDKGKILIARRPIGDKLAGKWEFPGGKIEVGETPEECLRREIKEELNIKISVGHFFAESIYEYPNRTIQLKAYWCTWLSGEIELNSHDAIEWVEFASLSDYDFAPADLLFVDKLRGDIHGL
ncbi:MAG: ADP-ribose pyrophosphatase [Firmicutes bacterium]|nr:ADP-ribose pyrophosphatase [Bacillota bacterium]